VQRSPVQDFYDTSSKPGEYPFAGRPWSASELRLKAFSDLHKLWFVLLKEKNMLLTERAASRGAQPIGSVKFINPKRLKKVRLSMARIKVVLGERQRVYAEARKKVTDLYTRTKYSQALEANRASPTTPATSSTSSSTTTATTMVWLGFVTQSLFSET